MKKVSIEYGIDDINKVAQRCVEITKDCLVITLTGSLGAGKTTLASHMMQIWGVTEPVVSPTFTYVNVYDLIDGRKAYHFDLYRLDNLEAFEQAGFTEYLYQDDSICLIEWPEIIMPLLAKSVCHITIDFIGLDKRVLTATIQQ